MDESVTNFRRCGDDWRYCNGLCLQCPLSKTINSTTVDKSIVEERENDS